MHALYIIGEALGQLSNLQATTLNATSINLTWTVSGFISQFQVTYSYTIKNCLEMGGPLTVTIINGSERLYTLRGLNEDSDYTITVRAFSIIESTMATTSADTLTSGNADYTLVMCMH
jgi:hypothetical protein